MRPDEQDLNAGYLRTVPELEALAESAEKIYGPRSRVARLAWAASRLCETIAATTDPKRIERDLPPSTIVTRVGPR